jgi:BirA family biotin operon repressor/biotin-[acetyl-CoA-carboxylase] ligase
MERWYSIFIHEGSAVILKAWRSRAHIKGRRVTVTSFGETLAGVAIDVDSDGALILETENGRRKRVVAGDVEYRR